MVRREGKEEKRGGEGGRRGGGGGRGGGRGGTMCLIRGGKSMQYQVLQRGLR